MSADKAPVPGFSSGGPIQVHVPEGTPRFGGQLSAAFGRFFLRLLGWKIRGEIPDVTKAVVAVAPHTSNWDWVLGMLCIFALNVRINYLIKASVFVWPLSVLLRVTGGIPIDRSRASGVVDLLVEEFTAQDHLFYVITPEGTRSRVGTWKTGFLHLAYRTGVPLILAGLDYRKKEILLAEPFELSGTLDIDLTRVQQYFAAFTGLTQLKSSRY